MKDTQTIKIPNQQRVWDNIAKKWNEYREIPSPTVVKFLKSIKPNKNKKEEMKILDLGCGSGRNFIKNSGIIYGVDFSKEMLKHAKEKAKKDNIDVELKQMKEEKIPFENDFFDAAICVAVLHCLTEKEQINLMKELYRVVKPKSKVLISVWSRNSPRLRNKPKECFVPWTVKTRTNERDLEKENEEKHQRYTYIYEDEELKEQAESVGFKVLRSWEERNINIIAEK